MRSGLAALTPPMRAVLFRLAAAAGVLVVAAAVVESAPGRHSLTAQSTAATQPIQVRKAASELPRKPIATPTPSAQPTPASAPAPAPVVAAAQPAPLPPAPPPAPRIVIGSTQQVLINQDRAANGLRPLSWNGCLATIAAQNAARMASQGFISHTNGPSLDLGCRLGSQAGENVGYWSAGINDAQLNAMFMASAEHRANILGPYHYVGTAWAVAPNGYAYIAVEFS